MKSVIVKRRPEGRLTTYRDRYRIAAALSVFGLPLPRILRLFGSDKERAGAHSYGATYQTLLQPFRFKPCKILEIGLLSGDSILAWRCFFPRGTTIGIDIEPKHHMAGDRSRIYQVDQGNADQLAHVSTKEGPFDIIIDDGSHLNHHQIFSFNRLFPHLKEGGIYIIEDVQTSFWSGKYSNMQWDGAHINQPKFADTCYGTFLEISKYLNHAEFESQDGVDPMLVDLGRRIGRIAFEHNMIIVWKRENIMPSNVIRSDGTAS